MFNFCKYRVNFSKQYLCFRFMEIIISRSTDICLIFFDGCSQSYEPAFTYGNVQGPAIVKISPHLIYHCPNFSGVWLHTG